MPNIAFFFFFFNDTLEAYMTENVKAALAKENKFSCNSWQIDLNAATPNHVSLNKGRGGCIT